jgi:hypothetical protein
VPGAVVCTDFIVGMGTLACLVAGSRAVDDFLAYDAEQGPGQP